MKYFLIGFTVLAITKMSFLTNNLMTENTKLETENKELIQTIQELTDYGSEDD